jgi:hypothetical protein
MRNLFSAILRAGTFLSIVLFFPISSAGQAGLMLGGKFVPRDSIYLYLFLGNSVMSGRDTPADTISNNYAWKYVMTNNCYTYAKPCPPQYSWQPGVDPMCFDSKNPLNAVVKYSPGTPFLKRMVKDYPGYYFGVAQLSGSAWQLTHFSPPNSGDLKAFVTQGNALKQNCHIAGVVMIFNIVEIQYCNGDSNYTNIVNYYAHIDSVITYLRTKLDIPDLPFIQSDYPLMGGNPKKPTTDDYSITGPWAGAIRALMAQNKLVAQNIPNSVVIPTDSLTMYTEDGLYTHYDHNGDFKWANRVADSICGRNWGPYDKCGSTNNALPARPSVPTRHSNGTCRIFFDGSNWSAFDKTGLGTKTVYLTNGRAVTYSTVSDLRSHSLLPGVYLVHAQILK